MQAYDQVALRLGIDMGIFNIMTEILPTGKLEVQEIARRIDADELLVSRIMRLLGAMGIFKEVGGNKYANGRLAPAYADGSPFPHLVLHM